MQFQLFNRTFYFFAEGRQFLKAIDMVEQYLIKPVVLFLLIILIIYFEFRFGAFLFKKEKLRNVLVMMSPWIYLLVILTLTIFNREVGERTFRVFDPWTGGEDGYHETRIIEAMLNLFFYIPYGFLLYKWGKYKRRYLTTIGIALVTSALTELLQLALARGVCSFDDIVMNTIGAFIGASIAVIFSKKRNDDVEKQ
jgi:hypothetical protein